jgi:phage/plasmid-associated DNA primase
LADGHKGVLKTRGLYRDNTQFPIFFQVNGCCNNKPTLSSVDGGIGRLVRVIEYPVKFVEDPDPENKYQAKLVNEMVVTLSSDAIRDTYMRLLIDYFINTSSNVKSENVAKKIKSDSNDYIADSNIVLGFVSDLYDITNNDKDRIKSSDLYTKFQMVTKDKMTSSKFKDDMLGIGGITFIKSNSQRYFCGIKVKPDETEAEESEPEE